MGNLFSFYLYMVSSSQVHSSSFINMSYVIDLEAEAVEAVPDWLGQLGKHAMLTRPIGQASWVGCAAGQP